MAIIYKIDVLQELKNKGFSTYKLRKDKIFGEATLQQFRNGEIVSTACLSKLCELLCCQPGDVLQYVEERECALET